MKPSPRRVLSLWRNNSNWRASLKDVREAMGTSKAQAPRLKSMLDELVAQGKLTYERHRYQSARPATPAATSAAKPDKRPASPSSSSRLTGSFSAHPDGFGFVSVENSDQSVFIPPRKDGGALDGDRVELVMEKRRGSDRSSGKVITVLDRARSLIRGVVHEERRELWLLPFNEKLPMVFLETRKGGVDYSRGDVVEVRIAEYPQDSRSAPTGQVLKLLPSPDTPDQIVDNILADCQIPVQFSGETGQEMVDLEQSAENADARAEPQAGAGPGRAGREDLTKFPFLTIDGADARDFDDAVCLMPAGKGSQLLLVAIADVAEFVRPGSAVDNDASTRGTSVYFPEIVVPMLPELLSNELCSLKPDVPRLTLVCEMTLDARGDCKAHRIFEAVIRSHARLTYEQVQRFFDGEAASVLDKGASAAPMLKKMLALSQLLAEKRGQRGALDFEFPEARFTFKTPGVPDAIERTLPTSATRLIEQFMLEANETVAKHCEDRKIPILYRVHDPPPLDQLEQLRIQLINFGITLSDQEFHEPSAVKSLLGRIADHPASEEISLLILKSMSQAQYRNKNGGHFGLAATHYAHFTSPIRRYPDLLLHRALKQAAAGDTEKIALPPEAGMALSTRERTAAEAESRVARLYRVLYMEQFLGEQFEAKVSGVSARGIWVRPRDVFVEGLLPMALLPDDNYRFDARRGVLRASKRKRVIGFGQKITVQLARADRLTQQLEFAFAGWDWANGGNSGI